MIVDVTRALTIDLVLRGNVKPARATPNDSSIGEGVILPFFLLWAAQHCLHAVKFAEGNDRLVLAG